MEQSVESKTEFKDKLINFYNSNKIKIFIIIILIIIFFTSFIFLKYKNEKENSQIAEKYVKAGIYLASNKENDARKIYEEIILSENKFYSILSLNTIIEKNLISDKDIIIKYFDILEKTISSQDQGDLIILKKALFLIKVSDIKNGNNLLKSLADKDTIIKPIVQDLLKK